MSNGVNQSGVQCPERRKTGAESEGVVTTFFRQSRLCTTGTVNLWCESCGEKIEGEPYETTFSGWCCCFDPIDFCSRECWENPENMFNTENWPEPARE